MHFYRVKTMLYDAVDLFRIRSYYYDNKLEYYSKYIESSC